MADTTIKPILSICATVSSRVKDLIIKDGQLIFIQDSNKIAFDFNGKRVFYNSIITLDTDYERTIYSALNGQYFFIIETAVLWTYQDEWIPLTTPPEEVIFIGTELPALGQAKKLYVNKQEKEIAVWDEEDKEYLVVSDKTESISEEEIASLFI